MSRQSSRNEVSVDVLLDDAKRGAAVTALGFGAIFLAAALSGGAAASAAAPAPAPEAPPVERNAILTERLRISRDERPSRPGDWLPRLR